MDVTLCSPQARFVIIEQVYSKSGIPAFGNTIGPSLQQVFRRVIQVCGVQNAFFNGAPIAGMPSTWQLIQELVLPGTQITTRDTGEQNLVLVYAGFRNIVTPLPTLKEHDLGGPPLGLFTYGSDPLPNVHLYGNSKVQFVAVGGKGAPTAVATYDASRNALDVPSVSDRGLVIQRLLEARFIK
jgi:hypothetical protein